MLLPIDWDYQNWVEEIIDKQTGIKYSYQEFKDAFPDIIIKQ